MEGRRSPLCTEQMFIIEPRARSHVSRDRLRDEERPVENDACASKGESARQ